MALINCPECGKEESDKAHACPNCGCPLDSYTPNEEPKPETDSNNSFTQAAFDYARESVSNAIDAWNDRFHATKKVGPVKIDEVHQAFQINGTVAKNGKKSGVIGKSFKGLMAVGTIGMSLVAEKAIGAGGNKIGTNAWHPFDDLLSYELIEDDSIVTSGGVGQALIGGAIFGGFGAVAGGITAKRVQKKKVESLMIKTTLNSFDHPCILIPLITRPTKTNSKEYQNAFNDAHNILSVLDVITHNK